MAKIREINVMTANNRWWRLLDEYPEEKTDRGIADHIICHKFIVLVRELVPFEDEPKIGNLLFLNTDNIIAIEIRRESEDE